MKVFVVLKLYDYEGYGEPEGVFSSQEKAELAIKQIKSKRTGGAFEVFELELDAVDQRR